jgi:chromosome partitioning protein
MDAARKEHTPGMTVFERAHVIVVGNEKGGSGKSTTAMHLIAALMGLGRSVASIDADVRQRSLTRYLDNRRAHAAAAGRALAIPEHEAFEGDADPADPHLQERFVATIRRFGDIHDVVVIDTPGNDTPLTRVVHSHADTLITPVNDSFIDLDVLARVEGPGDTGIEKLKVIGPSHYSEMVWNARKQRAARDGGSVDWIVMRNRLSSLDAHNKRRVEHVLAELSRRFGFRQLPGFGERVVYRELFPSGLTLMDLGETAGGDPLTLSHVAARQEVRALVEALRVQPLTRTVAVAQSG